MLSCLVYGKGFLNISSPNGHNQTQCSTKDRKHKVCPLRPLRVHLHNMISKPLFVIHDDDVRILARRLRDYGQRDDPPNKQARKVNVLVTGMSRIHGPHTLHPKRLSKQIQRPPVSPQPSVRYWDRSQDCPCWCLHRNTVLGKSATDQDRHLQVFTTSPLLKRKSCPYRNLHCNAVLGISATVRALTITEGLRVTTLEEKLPPLSNSLNRSLPFRHVYHVPCAPDLPLYKAKLNTLPALNPATSHRTMNPHATSLSPT